MREKFISLTPMVATRSKDLIVSIRSIKSIWVYLEGTMPGTRILLFGEQDPWCVMETPAEIKTRIQHEDLT